MSRGPYRIGRVTFDPAELVVGLAVVAFAVVVAGLFVSAQGLEVTPPIIAGMVIAAVIGHIRFDRRTP